MRKLSRRKLWPNLGLQVEQVAGDGSCLFHSFCRVAGALAWDVGGSQQLRKSATRHPEQYIEFGWHDFQRGFKEPTTWAGHEAVLAFADITGFGVHVCEPIQGPALRKTTVVPTEHAEAGIEKHMLLRTYMRVGSMQTCYLELTNPMQGEEIVHLPVIHRGEYHYDAVVPLKRSKEKKRKASMNDPLADKDEQQDQKSKSRRQRIKGTMPAGGPKYKKVCEEEDLREGDLDDYRRWTTQSMVDGGKHSRILSPHTVEKHLRAYRSLVGFLSEGLVENHYDAVVPLKKSKNKRKRQQKEALEQEPVKKGKERKAKEASMDDPSRIALHKAHLEPDGAKYIVTLEVVYALSKAFVLPRLGGRRAIKSLNYLDAIGSIQKTALQKLKLGSSKLSGRGMVVKAGGDEEGPSAKTFVTTKGDLLMEDLRSRLKSFREKLSKMEKQLAKHGRAQTATVKDLRLKVAKAKMSLLATMLLLWHTGRTKEIRTAVVNKEGFTGFDVFFRPHPKPLIFL